KSGDVGLGAWEIAGRVSYVELRNPSSLSGHYYDSTTNLYNAPASKGAVGNGTLTDTTLGLTWFLNAHSKFQFNWIHAFLHTSSRRIFTFAISSARFACSSFVELGRTPNGVMRFTSALISCVHSSLIVFSAPFCDSVRSNSRATSGSVKAVGPFIQIMICRKR